MKQSLTNTTNPDNPPQANNRSKLPKDVTGHDLSIITSRDGRKIRLVFPAGTPRKELAGIFENIGVSF